MSIFFAAPIDEHPDYDKVTTTPTNSEADVSFPVSNLLTFDPTQVHKNTDTTMVIHWDFGANKDFDVVALIYTNLTDAATWRVEASLDNSAWVDLVPDATPALAHYVAGQTTQNKRNMLRKNHCLYNSSVNRNYRYLRITVTSNVSGLFPSVGRLFVGKKFVPATGWQYGSNIEFIDLSRRERTDRGALVVEPLPPILAGTVKMEFLSKQEMMDFIWEFNYWRGSAREMLACLDVEETKYLQKNLMYCTISEGRRISFDSYNNHGVNWNLENIAP